MSRQKMGTHKQVDIYRTFAEYILSFGMVYESESECNREGHEGSEVPQRMENTTKHKTVLEIISQPFYMRGTKIKRRLIKGKSSRFEKISIL